MVTTIIHCDKCKSIITEGRSRLDAVAGPMATTKPTVDVCRGCAALLSAWLDSPAPQTEESHV